MQANIRYRTEKDSSFNEQEHRQKVDAILKQYSAEHAKLVPFNQLQRTAIRASVLLGEGRIDSCVRMLKIIDKVAQNDNEFAHTAAQYSVDDQGNPVPYKP